MTHQEFLIRARAIHGDKYEYPDTTDVKWNDYIMIHCNCDEQHEDFKQRISVHLGDECGCPKCGLKNRKHPQKSSNGKFIEKARAIHGDAYDYSRVVYVNALTDVEITCHKHNNTFSMRPNTHLSQKQGCRFCGLENRKHPGQKTTETFIEQAQAKWADQKYDYSKTVYKNKTTKIAFRCPTHKEVEQMPTLHLRTGCPHCAGRGVGKHTKETFTKRAKEVHGDTYDYSKIVIDSVEDHVVIGCPNPEHGDFRQSAKNHINLQNGCPACASELTTSKAEQEVANFLATNYSGTILRNNRQVLNYKEIDIFLPDIKLGVEYHGLFWHSESVVGDKYHSNKADIATKKDIRLIQIFEHEWKEKRLIVESRLKSIMGLNERIFARKTKIVEIAAVIKNRFLTSNHIQGADSSSVWLGLEYDGELVACMTFGKPRFSDEYEWELIRYCSKLNLNVVGGAGKLLQHFRRKYEGSIVSYADRRWSIGGLYRSLGFKEDGIVKAGYFYYHLKNKTIHNRIAFQKHKLASMLIYDEGLTEAEIMKLNGYDRIWNAGNSRWVFG